MELKMKSNPIDQFFFRFSRAEYALKASRFLQNSGEAKADWDKYANNIRDTFDANRTEELKNAVKYIKENPPKKQVVENGQLAWQQTDNESMHLALFLNVMVRRIRNNLFHGGKFQNGASDDISRDLQLINSANIILLEMVGLHDEVKHYFEQPIK